MSTQRLALTAFVILALLAPGAAASLAQPAASPAAAELSTSSGSMLIVENAGQWPAPARFQAWNSPLGAGTTWLAEDAIWLVVAGGTLPQRQVAGGTLPQRQVAGSKSFAGALADLPPANLQPATLHALKLTFPGSSPDVRIEPFGPVDTTVSYFIGHDPTQWRSDVPVWSGVRYVNLYPGVDLLLGGSDDAWRLEAAPSAGVDRVRMKRVKAIALDSAGQTTLTGSAVSQGFPTTPGAYDTTFNGGLRCYNSTGDAFVTRLNANGSALAFSSFLGGSHGEGTFDVAVDNAGRATVVGETCSVDFPTTSHAFDTSLGGMDGFVTRFDANGQNLDYSTYLGGGSSSDHAYGVALDSQGRAITAGFTVSDGFPTTPGAYDPDYTPGLAGFIAKLDMDPYAPNVLAPIEQPSAGAFVAGMVTLMGYAIDRRSPSGTGIDLVHVYLDGPYGTGTIIGGATYGLERPDIAAQCGERFRPSGWELAWDASGLAPGVHRLYLYAYRTTDNAWSLMNPHLVIVPGGPTRWLPIVLRQE